MKVNQFVVMYHVDSVNQYRLMYQINNMRESEVFIMDMPNCRKDDYYNQDFIEKEDADFLDGFDWCVEMAVDNFFDNGMYGILDEESYLGKILSEELPEDMQETYVMEYAFPKADPKKPEERKCRTYADFIKLHMLAWIEMERNELITSMVDNTDDETYKMLRNQKLKDNEKLWGTDKYKVYYDTRKFKYTGEKECGELEGESE